VLLAATAIIAIVPARAQQAPTNLGTVTANGAALSPTLPADTGPFQPPSPNSAAALAPSHAPLEAAQPTSVVSKSFIDNSTIPSQNYDELVKFTPSLMNIQPAGPVSQQNYGESIRGFQYNQFNTTFDNLVLPGTISNFAPQSATYFTSHDLGSLTVDRGPGTASTNGYATFGGTLALYSKQPLDQFGAQAYSTFGSFGEQLYGIEVDSGAVPELNGGRGFIDLSRLQTGSYLTYVTTNRDNAFGKWEQPIGDNTLVTFVGMYNDSTGDTAYGSTLAQIQKYGPDYGLNNNPESQAFHGYNFDRYDTDFEYIRVESNLGDGWTFQETSYTDSYFRSGTEGTDPNGTTPNIEPGGTKAYIGGIRIHPEDDVPGVSKHNDFRDWGSVTRLTKDTPWGQLRIGTWFDYVSNGVYRTRIDFTDDDTGYATKATGSTFNQQYHDRLVTAQPYVEFAWTPLPDHHPGREIHLHHARTGCRHPRQHTARRDQRHLQQGAMVGGRALQNHARLGRLRPGRQGLPGAAAQHAGNRRAGHDPAGGNHQLPARHHLSARPPDRVRRRLLHPVQQLHRQHHRTRRHAVFR
jgi:iron complex outermembrane receptor protein